MLILKENVIKENKMNNFKYLKYLIKHKFYVTRECFRIGLYWRGLVHDLSKFTPSEWIAYRNYFYGTWLKYNPIIPTYGVETKNWSKSTEGVSEAFDYAWLQHQHKNKHHWQHWILRNDDGTITPMMMPDVYIKEMVCDWLGAGMAITGKREADMWYKSNKHNMQLHELTRGRAEMLLEQLL